MKHSYEIPEPGETFIVKRYNTVMLVVMEVREQTRAEAAAWLRISLTFFYQLLRGERLPDWNENRPLARRFEKWCGDVLTIDELFPPAYYSEQRLKQEKTAKISFSHRDLMRMNASGVTLSLPPPEVVMPPPPASKRKRNLAAHQAKHKAKK